MNSNLKRVLSVALMTVMLAVNFMIPALAADYTISYEVLTGYDLANGQGTVFYDTTPTGYDTNISANFKSEFYPLDVLKTSANKDALTMKASEWVRFEVEVSEGGYYSVDMNLKVPAQNTVVAIYSENTIIDAPLTRGNAFANKTGLGYLYLTAGTNYVYLNNKSDTAQIVFKTISFTKVETVDSKAVKTLALVENFNEAGQLTFDNSDVYNTAELNGASLTYPITIQEDGKYGVKLRGKTAEGSTAEITLNGTTKTVNIAGSDSFGDSTPVIFPLTAGNYTLTISGLDSYKLAWAVVEYVAPYATLLVDSSVHETGDVIARGTDNFTFEYNDTMDSAAENVVTLTAADGSEIPTQVDVEDKTVTVSILKTLEFDTEYTLTMSGFKSVNDEVVLAETTYSFRTDVEGNDNGTDDVTVTGVTSELEAVTVTGTVLGTTDKPIAGRKVSVNDPDGNPVTDAEGNPVGSVVSNENGAFTIDFMIPEGVTDGQYTYKVISEYGAQANATVNYMSSTTVMQILASFNAEGVTAVDVAKVLTEYCQLLDMSTYKTKVGYYEDLTADPLVWKPGSVFTGSEPQALFHNHFIGKTFNHISEIAPFYEKILLLEQMNQEKVVPSENQESLIETVIKSEESCNQIGFSADAMAMLSLLNDAEKKTFAKKLIEDTKNNGPENSEEAFKNKFDTLLNAHLKEVKGISTPNFGYNTQTAITNVYVSGAVVVPLSFQTEQKYVSNIKVEVTATGSNNNVINGASLLENGTLSSNKITYTKSLSGNVATFEANLDHASKATLKELGDLTLISSVIDVYDLAINITVTYRFDTTVNEMVNGESVPVTKTVEYIESAPAVSVNGITVSQMPNDSTRVDFGPTGGGGGGYVAPPKEKEEEKEDEVKSAYFFDDMKEALWAQDMVHELVGKGVISKNTERAFRPMDNITREEVVKMLVTVVGTHNPDAKSTLSDVAANHWATSYIATAQELGIVQGNADGSFGLGTNITRQDMAVMIYRTFQMLGIDLSTGNAQFNDAGEIASYATTAVSALEKQGIINGMGDNTFAPAANATRAQAAKVIYVMMEVLGL